MLGHSATCAAGQGHQVFSISLHSCLPSRGGGLEVGPTAALAVLLIRRAPCPALEAAARDAFFVVEHPDPTLGHESYHMEHPKATPAGHEEVGQPPGA